MKETKHWITKLVPVLAFAAGIIIASIGGIMTISSSLKLALFETDSYSYVTEESCRYDYTKPTTEGQQELRNAEEIELCIADREQEEKERFQKNQKENIVDGMSALIVGGILLLTFRKRK